MIKDERLGLPSASGMERLVLCPGSWLAEKKVTPTEPSEDAKAGTRIASSVENYLNNGKHNEDLNATELEVAHKMVQQTAEAYNAVRDYLVAEGVSAPEVITDEENCMFVEDRMWDDEFTPHFSGKADVAIINNYNGWGLIIDHKSGWNEVADPTDNWQLKTLALLFQKKFPKIEKMFVSIVQPHVGKPRVALLTPPVLRKTWEEIEDAIAAAALPGAPLKPSTKTCRYCKARPTCPAARQTLINVSTLNGIPDDLGLALEMVQVAEMVANDIRNQAKESLAKDPNSIPGWKLRPGSTTNSVTDTAAAFSKVKDILDPLAFTRCTTVRFSELVGAYATAAKLKKSEAKQALIGRLDGIIEQRVNAPSLIRSTSTPEE